MSSRRLYLDAATGETRGVITLNGLPERLLIQRIDDLAVQKLGARVIGRVRRIERPLASLFIDLGEGPDAVLSLNGSAAGLAEGAGIEIEIAAEARWGKGAVARLIGLAEGAPRLCQAAPALPDQLEAVAPGAPITEGPAAREAADIAEAAALAVEHALPGGGLIAIEPTRALTAVDVDMGAGGGDPRRGARRTNLAAIEHAARLLRLKALGGLIVFDLVGAGHDGAALAAAAKTAFAEDEPGVSIGPVSRFGLLQLALPRRARPISEILCGPGGAPTPITVALRLLRALEREGRADGGARLLAQCAPAVSAAARPYMRHLAERIGARFEICEDAALAADQFRVSTR